MPSAHLGPQLKKAEGPRLGQGLDFARAVKGLGGAVKGLGGAVKGLGGSVKGLGGAADSSTWPVSSVVRERSVAEGRK